MSIFHCSIKIISHSGGRSAVASAAYRSGERLLNDETGIIHDYSHRRGVVMNEIMLPEGTSSAFLDRSFLWNEVQHVEKRSDAQLAREVEVAFPIEMTRDEQIECVRSFIRENFTDKGMIADWALHDKERDIPNPHAHILLTMRRFDGKEGWCKKQRTVFANARDKNGRAIYDPTLPCYDPKDKEHTSQYRIPALDKDGKQKTRTREGKGTEYLWEKISIPANDWNDHARAEEWRASWARHCNRYLSPENRIDHRSFKRRGIDLEPSIHEGYIARQMEKRGEVSDRCEVNREIKERNEKRRFLARLWQELVDFIIGKVWELYERLLRYRGVTGDARSIEQTGTDDRDHGRTAGGYREAGTGAFRQPDGDSSGKGSIGRIHELERELEQRKQTADQTDLRIAELRKEVTGKEAAQNERIRKLMERRGASLPDGTAAGSDRGSRIKTVGAAGRKRLIDQTTAGRETDALIRSIKASIRAADSREEDSRAERDNREAKRSRSSHQAGRVNTGRSFQGYDSSQDLQGRT